MSPAGDRYSAAEQVLGYLYQARLALLRLLQLPESDSVLIEKDDDLEFTDQAGIKSLNSLKHKAPGDRLADLGVDFWKSVRIWLSRYQRDGRTASSLKFFLLTTGVVADDSFLAQLLPHTQRDRSILSGLAEEALTKSDSKTIRPIAGQFNALQQKRRQTS